MNFSNRIHNALRWIVALLTLISIGACAGLTEPSSKERLTKAHALLAQRCQTAGVKIHRTVKNVDGIYLLKLRPKLNFGDQFALTDPYGNDLEGDAYIKSFLRGFWRSSFNQSSSAHSAGYMYVEAIDPKDGQRYRYVGNFQEVERDGGTLTGGPRGKFKTTTFELTKTLATGPAPRYGLIYDDISTCEERIHWIAGSSLKVIDLQTNEVLAERVGYMMDSGQGNISGGRSPWLYAAKNSCPWFVGEHPELNQIGQTERFVEEVLKPAAIQGN
ncbi:MAG: hypothetical protein Q7V20_08310 [Aquabacterium sp.]|uniref:hypothetical protein n=1 Tax=Aquabacterium sp. TaxID=1872578 RepID=UPI0027163DB1|nr:hypothetical protein [Aquabacterium sp.]MDO9003437.1 hypothetical protein [Aquabacterium sp.]